MTATSDSRSKRICGPIAVRIGSELEKGATALLSLDDEIYCQKSEQTGSVGGHIRHNLDLVSCFLKGLKTGVIDYSLRERDLKVETDRKAAIAKTEVVAQDLRTVSLLDPDTAVQVVSEVESGVQYVSTIGRELEFLHSHTVHHHAIINEKISHFGIEAGEGFGVAPSTLKYWKGGAAESGR